MNEIADVRHKIAHFSEIDEDEAAKAWIHMKAIAKLLRMDELEVEIGLRNGTPPDALIDFHHFKFFAIKNKALLNT